MTPKKRLFIFMTIIVLLSLLAYFYPIIKANISGDVIKENKYEKESAYVLRVIDGDTLELNTSMKVRLLGINTPEKGKPYYDEAKDFLKQLENKSVDLLRDNEDMDRYGRKLRYVFFENKFMNVEIVQNGLATTFMLDDLYYKDKFVAAEDFAKKNNIGLWLKSENICADCLKLKALEPSQDYFILKNDCDFDCTLKGWFVKDDANHFFQLTDIPSQDTEEFKCTQGVWNNDHDRFFLRDDKGGLVLFYEY